MKKSIYLAGLLIYSLATFASSNQVALSGRVTDKTTGEPLQGVYIYVPDLKTGTTTGVDGTYKLNNLHETRILVHVMFTSYKTIIQSIDLTETTTVDFELEEAVTELHEVVVTGMSHASERSKAPTPITIVTKNTLLQNSSTNIIDALSTQPGVSQVTTGSGISKPVIRGLGYNRVLVVNDGIRQEGQQWGDEHGIEIDEFSVNKVEILKGPASISYGSDAMAGVINMLSAPVLAEGAIKGSLLTTYQSNNGLLGYSANLAGNQKGFIWDLRSSGKTAHAYKNAYDGYVFNSGFSEQTFGGIAGVSKRWGYSHLHFSVYNFTPGLVEGDRDDVTGKFTRAIAIDETTEGTEIVSDEDLKSYDEFVPYQKVHHYKLALNNSFFFGDATLLATLGWQQNQRQEFTDVLNPNQYGLFFSLNTVNYDVRYLFPERNDWSISLGMNGMWQTNENKGAEFLIPEYRLLDWGGFAIVKKMIGKIEASAGLRYDVRSLNADALTVDSDEVFKEFKNTYSNVAGSIGASYSFTDDIILKFNASRGFRAPNITELSANGVHEGAFRYIHGDDRLNPETSVQLDAGLIANSDHVSFELTVFNNAIDNFIFLQKLSSTQGGDSITVDDNTDYQTFQYAQGKAVLTGGEVLIDMHPHPLDWLHFANSFSIVNGVQKNATDSTKYLPLIPAAKFTSELKATIKKVGSFLSNTYFKAGIDYYFEKDKVYTAYQTETATPAYWLLNAGLGTDFISKGNTICSLFISMNNLTDAAYQSHLSRLKYADMNSATGRSGVFNMGRNISVKLIFPFTIKKEKRTE